MEVPQTYRLPTLPTLLTLLTLLTTLHALLAPGTANTAFAGSLLTLLTGGSSKLFGDYTGLFGHPNKAFQGDLIMDSWFG